MIKKLNKKNMYMLVTICVVIVLIGSAVIYNLISLDDEKKDDETIDIVPLTELLGKTYAQLKQEGLIEKIQITDENISTLTNQAVTFEVNRIRKKGIEEQMRKIGNSWKNTPSYYFEVILHNGLWEGHKINKWDTGYVGWEAFREVDDELEACTIKFTIYETEKTGILGRKTKEVEKESFSIEYCFRTGRWTGDSRLEGGLLGNGYLNGDNFEVWFDVHQSDYDGDDIPYWTEVNILGTDPRVDDRYQDPDGDGIPTAWEWKWGYNPFVFDNHTTLDPEVDGLSNIEEYKLAKWGANPYRKDIYVEVDHMEKGSGLFAKDHVFYEESKQMVMDKFAEKDITLHIDNGIMGGGGELLEFYEEFIDEEGGIASEYYKYHFADERKGVFRYCVIVHKAGWCHPQDSKLAMDVMAIPANLKYYINNFKPFAVTPRLQRVAMAVAFMHELGHTLGLRKVGSIVINPGIDNNTQIGRGMGDIPPLQKSQKQKEAREYWTNYESCMNYDKFGQYVLGYSDGTHGERDVDDWSLIDFTFFQRHEPMGLCGIRKDVE
jgi:hypothetical protein